MMLPTHILLGLTLASPLFVLFPEHTTALIGASVVGSTFPDFDLLIGQHRRTLHRTVYILPLLIVAVVGIILTPHILFLVALAGGLSMLIHSPTDFIGGGLSKHPWKSTNDQTVYDHYNDMWRYHNEALVSVQYDGSPYDLLVLVCLAGYLSIFRSLSVWLVPLLIGCVSIGVLYTGVRKYLPRVETLLYKHIPILRPFIDTLHGEDESE